LLSDKTLTPNAAAKATGISSAAVYKAVKARQGKTICPCCGQVVREGFAVKVK